MNKGLFNSMTSNRFVVSSNKDITGNEDQTEATLRAAIHATNKFYNTNNIDTPFYIDFEADDGFTSSWIIKPEIPFPPIIKGNVYINYNEPKLVILSGSELQNNNPEELNLKNVVRPQGILENQNSSLLTLGDSKIMSDLRKLYEKPEESIFRLKSINFSSNIARGEDGVNGGGGGLGAGGGLSIVSGKVIIEDAVFQNLKAIGGKGSKAGTGGEAGKGLDKKGGAGKDGGAGGLRGAFTLPVTETISRCQGGDGGQPTEKGTRPRNSHYVPEKDRGYDMQSDAVWGMAGANGQEGESCEFVVGNGGGGGGGGGGGTYGGGGRKIAPNRSTTTQNGDGGRGGDGGGGGYGAGSGGGGGSGTPTRFEQRGLGYGVWKGGGKGGSVSWNHKTLAGKHGEENKSINKGGKGGDGHAYGGAIAVFSPYSEVDLINVDFINTTAEATAESSSAGVNAGIYWSMGFSDHRAKNVYIYENADDEKPTLVPNDVHFYTEDKWKDQLTGIWHKIPDTTQSMKTVHEAASFARHDDIAKIRDQFISLQPGIEETVIIRYDRPKSGKIDINIDDENLRKQLDDIYRKIIPVQDEKSIKAKHQNELINAGIKFAGDLAGISSITDLFKSSQGLYTSQDKNKAIGSTALTSVAKFGFSIYNAEKNLDKSIDQNNKLIAELSEKTNPKREILKAASIDITESRSLVNIDNFTIGEDTIILEDFGNIQDFNRKGVSGPSIKSDGDSVINGSNKLYKNVSLHFGNPKNKNIVTRFAKIGLDPDSLRGLSSPIIRDPATYMNSLIQYNEKSGQFNIGKTLVNDDLIQKSSNYFGGPAGETVNLVRKSGTLNSEIIEIETQNKSDLILGTDGNEKLKTNSGNDQIIPGNGVDIVNGGDGFDRVDYQDLNKPIKITSSSIKDVNNSGDITNFKIENLYAEETSVLDSNLQNIESISVHGHSSIDISGANKPYEFKNQDGDQVNDGYYAIRTGSGSSVKGSNHNDKIIVSLESDETDYLDTRLRDDVFFSTIYLPKTPDVSFSEILKKVPSSVISMESEPLSAKHIEKRYGRTYLDKINWEWWNAPEWGTYLFTGYGANSGWIEDDISEKNSFTWVDNNGEDIGLSHSFCDIPDDLKHDANYSSNIGSPLCGKKIHPKYIDFNTKVEYPSYIRLVENLKPSNHFEHIHLGEEGINRLINLGVIEEGLYPNRPEVIKIFVNESLDIDPKEWDWINNSKWQPKNEQFKFNYLDDRMTLREARDLAWNLSELSKGDIVEIWTNVNGKKTLHERYSDYTDNLNEGYYEGMFAVRFKEFNRENDYQENIRKFQSWQPLKVLDRPTYIDGGEGKDEVMFVIPSITAVGEDGSGETLFSSNWRGPSNTIDVLLVTKNGYRPVVYNDTIIAFIKDINVVGFEKNYTLGIDTELHVNDTFFYAPWQPKFETNKNKTIEEDFIMLPLEDDASGSQGTDQEIDFTENSPFDIARTDDSKFTVQNSIIYPLSAQESSLLDISNYIQGSNSGKDKISGTLADDTVVSGTGKDKLLGSGGNDVFWIKEIDEFSKKGIDMIVDFDSKEGDSLILGNTIDNWISQNGSIQLVSISSKKNLKQAMNSDAELVYFNKKKSGILYYNQNKLNAGWGKGGPFLKLKGSPDLLESEIYYVVSIPEPDYISEEISGAPSPEPSPEPTVIPTTEPIANLEDYDLPSVMNSINGSENDDKLKGTKKSDMINGKNGDDILNGSKGDDVLIGNTGNDLLNGSKGKDYLDGSQGEDILIGGKGADVFQISLGEDIVEDFSLKEGDKIALDGNNNYSIIDSPNGVLVMTSESKRILLRGLNYEEVQAVEINLFVQPI